MNFFSADCKWGATIVRPVARREKDKNGKRQKGKATKAGRKPVGELIVLTSDAHHQA